jgi:hypothetical protein
MAQAARGLTHCSLIWMPRTKLPAPRGTIPNNCASLFSRSDIQLELLSGPTPLSDVLADVASTLRRYGKGIA